MSRILPRVSAWHHHAPRGRPARPLPRLARLVRRAARVDSHSTDQTRQLAAAHGARVIERDWPGTWRRRSFAVRAARHDWVLCIDADERVSPELRARSRRSAAASSRAPRATRCRACRATSAAGSATAPGIPTGSCACSDRRRGGWAGAIRTTARKSRRGAPARGELRHEPYRSFDDHLRHDRPLHHDHGRGDARRGPAGAPLGRDHAPARALLRVSSSGGAASSTAGAASCSPISRRTTCGSSPRSLDRVEDVASAAASFAQRAEGERRPSDGARSEP